MAIKFLNICLIMCLLSCSFQFDKEIVNHGSNLKYIDKIMINEGKTEKSFIINKLGPPSFTNPFNQKNVFYIAQEMKKEIGKVNQFKQVIYLEIFYNENDKVTKYNYKKDILPYNLDLSKLNDNSIAEDRTTFEIFKNIFSNLRRRTDN